MVVIDGNFITHLVACSPGLLVIRYGLTKLRIRLLDAEIRFKEDEEKRKWQALKTYFLTLSENRQRP
jgi:hypothetical protein